MTGKENYFFDTYAILEIINGSKNYDPYMACGVILTRLNLFELYYTILRMYGQQKAFYYLGQYKQFAVDFIEIDIEMAARLKMKNRSLSMTDCIGYIVALRKCLKFLTGDKEFQGMSNVEFVK